MSSFYYIARFLYLPALVLVSGTACQDRSQDQDKPNIVFIICDDLNDSVEGMGGHPQARTPNINRLAREGIWFTNTHSAAPICGPSRASFLTGIYPHNSGLYGHKQNQNAWHNNPVLKNSKPIFEHFADNGYMIFGAGKLFHNNHNIKPLFNRPDGMGEFGNGMEYGPFAWTGKRSDHIYKNLVAHPDIPRKFGTFGFASFASLDNIPTTNADTILGTPGYSGWFLADGKPFRYVNEDDRNPLPDEMTADYAIEKLQQDHHKPFFLTVGIIRPHAPWHAPKAYFDMFPLDQIMPPPYLENDLEDCAEELWYQPGPESRAKEHRFLNLLESYDGDEGWKRFIQGYLACVAFADAQVGRILDAIYDSKYASNTIIVFTSDHGYHMGEKNQLFKRTIWEESTRVPMIIRLPEKKNAGLLCDKPVGLIDIYPTLVDLCGIPDNTMRNEDGYQLDGHSLRPFLEDPVSGSWDGPSVALSCIEGGIPVMLNEPGKVTDQQFTVRSRDWRYVLTRTGAEELYDHRSDPHEWHNLADDPQSADIKKELNAELLKMTGRGI